MPTVDYESRIETTMGRIRDSDEIHPDNKQAIEDFKRDLKLDGMSDAWISKLAGHLYIISEHIGDQRFTEMDEDDLKDVVEWVQNKKKENGDSLSEATVNAYKQVIKRFWRWLYDSPDGEHPDMVSFINTSSKNGGNGKLPKDILTREDVKALKDACRNTRDRAFIAMLYETGARIGELIDLTVGDIEDHKHGRKVVIDGKTGQRRLPLLEATPAINKWLNDHPDPTKDAPLWCQLRDGSKELSYHYIRQKLLVRAKERAEIEKPVNPHHFRHSRATHLANEFKEAQLCEWFGWVQGSDVPAKYVHLSGRDIDKAYGKLHGIEPVEKDEEEETIQECPRCAELNEADAKFCMRCGQALDIEAVEELESAESETTESADSEDMELALQIAKAMREKPEEVEEFLADL